MRADRSRGPYPPTHPGAPQFADGPGKPLARVRRCVSMTRMHTAAYAAPIRQRYQDLPVAVRD